MTDVRKNLAFLPKDRRKRATTKTKIISEHKEWSNYTFLNMFIIFTVLILLYRPWNFSYSFFGLGPSVLGGILEDFVSVRVYLIPPTRLRGKWICQYWLLSEGVIYRPLWARTRLATPQTSSSAGASKSLANWTGLPVGPRQTKTEKRVMYSQRTKERRMKEKPRKE